MHDLKFLDSRINPETEVVVIRWRCVDCKRTTSDVINIRERIPEIQGECQKGE